MKVQKVGKSFVDRSDLNALPVQLKLVESNIIIINKCLTDIAFEDLNIPIKVVFIDGAYDRFLIKAQKKQQHILKLRNLHEYIIIAYFP